MLVKALSTVRVKWQEFGECVGIVKGTVDALHRRWRGKPYDVLGNINYQLIQLKSHATIEVLNVIVLFDRLFESLDIYIHFDQARGTETMCHDVRCFGGMDEK